MDYIEIWKEVILRPSDFYRKMPKTGGYTDPLTFAAISFIIYGLLTALFNREMYMSGMYGMYGIREFSFFMVLMIVIMAPIAGIISLLIEAVVFYILFKIVGGAGSYEGTLRLLSYATAVLLLSWIPFIGWLMGLYGIYLYIVGGTFVHNISMGRSAIAVFLPTILVFLLIIILAGLFVFSLGFF